MKKYHLFFILSFLFIPAFVMAAGKIDTKFVNKFKGQILLQVQGHGEAWYLNPVDGRRYYLKDGAAAYELMRKFGQGTSNGDLEKIPVGTIEIVASSEKPKAESSAQTSSEKTTTANTTLRQPQSVSVQTPAPKEEAPPEFFLVTRVVDGDTFDVMIGGKTERIRTIGMDTPETVDPRKPVQCFGKEASNKTTELLLNKKVRLEADSTQGERDKYDRLLRYVYREDGLFFNKWMLENGYATEYTYNLPYKFQTEFKYAAKTAQENKNGLWAPDACNAQQDTQSSSVAASVTPTPEQSSNKQEPIAATSNTGHTWYLSSYHTSRFYYCDTDLTWQGLSKKYLKSFTSEAELLKKYPKYTLHESCK